MNQLLLRGFRLLINKSFVLNSVTVEGVWNLSRYNDGKTLGGFEPQDSAAFVCESSLVPNAKSLIGKNATIDGASWRVSEVSVGDAVTHLTFVSHDKS